MRVLLVDDEVDLASALAERLELRGIEAHWTTNAQKALELASQRFYDLAVLDVKMPKVGGVALMEQLHALTPKMKFIFLTGYGSEKDFQTVAKCAGDRCYLVKPVDIQVLIDRMNWLLSPNGGKSATEK